MSSSRLRIPTAEAFVPLLEPARYKGAHGGRGSGKSHFFAGLLIEDALRFRGLRAVCVREVQKSLKDSAKRLIEDKLIEFKLGEANGFRVFREVIETPGDGMIIFQGMQDHTAESIKSLEGFSRAWCEEAQTLSQKSLDLLRPTIRADHSELWFSWNPRHQTDPVDLFLRGEHTPDNAVVVQANYQANPWFPATLREEMRVDRAASEEKYLHVWCGDYEYASERCVFERAWIRAAQAECYRPDKRMRLEGDKFVDHSDGELLVWDRPGKVGRYVIGADVARGFQGGNYSCADVLDSKGYQVAQWHGHCAPDRFGKILAAMGYWYNTAFIGVEVNNHGLATNINLRDSGYPMLYAQTDLDYRGSGDRQTRSIGWLTTGKSKELIINKLAAELRDNESGIVCADTVRELGSYVIDENGSYNAQPGCYDDRVMSRAIAGEMLYSQGMARRAA